jgi:hypothetical protein
MASGSNSPNNPTTSIDDSKFMRQGHTSGPYGNNPSKNARGEFGTPAKDLRP